MPGGRPQKWLSDDERSEQRKIQRRIWMRIYRVVERKGRFSRSRERTKIEIPVVVRCCELLIERHLRRQARNQAGIAA